MLKRIHLHKWPSRTISDNGFFRLKRDRDAVRGNPYWVIEFKKPGVRIVARDELGRLLLVRQYRHPLGRHTWEIPAGGVEGNETALQAAKRELHEECGFVAGTWTPMLNVVSMPNATNFEASVFRANNLRMGANRDKSPKNTEVSEHRFFSPDELRQLIISGELNDDKSLAALCLEEVFSLGSNVNKSEEADSAASIPTP